MCSMCNENKRRWSNTKECVGLIDKEDIKKICKFEGNQGRKKDD
jgi:hypothetical protein